MKKISYLLLTLILLLILTNCRPTTLGNPPDSKVYIEEFPHVLAYDNMELSEFRPSNEGMSIGTYLIKDTSYEEFLSTYEEILNNDGWAVVNDLKPDTLVMEKEDRTIVLIAQQSVDPQNVNLTIMAN